MKDTSGPAFPVAVWNEHQMRYVDAGMSLRDYFAAHAPEPSDALVSVQHSFDRGRNPHNEPHKPPVRNDVEIRAYLRYQWADAMLAERAKS